MSTHRSYRKSNKVSAGCHPTVGEPGHKQDRKTRDARSRRIIGRRIHPDTLSHIAGETIHEGSVFADSLAFS